MPCEICLREYADSEGPDQPAVSSGPPLSANRIVGYCSMHEWRANALMILCACAVLSESVHFEHGGRHILIVNDLLLLLLLLSFNLIILF